MDDNGVHPTRTARDVKDAAIHKRNMASDFLTPRSEPWVLRPVLFAETPAERGTKQTRLNAETKTSRNTKIPRNTRINAEERCKDSKWSEKRPKNSRKEKTEFRMKSHTKKNTEESGYCLVRGGSQVRILVWSGGTEECGR